MNPDRFERSLLTLMAIGLTDGEIIAGLHISQRTVNFSELHISRSAVPIAKATRLGPGSGSYQDCWPLTQRSDAISGD